MLRQVEVVSKRTFWGFNWIGIRRSVLTVLARKRRRFRRRVRGIRWQHEDVFWALLVAAASVGVGVFIAQLGG